MRKITSIIMLLTIFCISAQHKIERDIVYTHNTDNYSQSRCRLDISYPINIADSAKLPVVVWFHGGGLTGGERSLPQELTSENYVVIAPNYRLIPQVTVSDCIDDAAAAVAWAFENARNYGGDTSKIIVCGHSAGGYLTSMIGLDRKWLARYGHNADSIALLAPQSGQVITHFSHRKAQGIAELQPTIDSLAPLFHVRADAPAYLIITGDRNLELYGRYEENAYMWRMLQLNGHPDVHIYELQGHGHGAMLHPSFHIIKSYINAKYLQK